MRVALIGREGSFEKSPVFVSGIKRYSYELSNALSKLSKEYPYPEFKTFRIENKYKIHTLSSYLYSLDFDDDRYNIVHLMEQGLPFSPRKKSTIRLTTIHDMSAHFNKQAYMTSIKMRGFYQLLYAAEKMALDSDYIIVISSQSKEEVSNVGFPKERIFVVNYGISKSFSEPLHQKPKEFIAGCLGGFTDKENARAMKTVNCIADSTIKFDFWGPILTTQNLDLITDKRIRIKGIANEKILNEVYDGFGVYMNTSVHEGFGFSLLEAQARGIPVIIYKNARIPAETRKHCIEAKDEADMARIIEEIKKNGYSERKIKDAMEYARSFTWERAAKNTLEVYSNILNKKF